MSEQRFKPSKQLTFATVNQDSNAFLAMVTNTKTTSIRLELQDIEQCDSAGLALLIETKRLCRKYKKHFIIEGMPAVIKALAAFCGVEKILVSDGVGRVSKCND